VKFFHAPSMLNMVFVLHGLVKGGAHTNSTWYMHQEVELLRHVRTGKWRC